MSATARTSTTFTSLFFIMRSSSTGPVVNAIFASKYVFALAGSLLVTCVGMIIPSLGELLTSRIPPPIKRGANQAFIHSDVVTNIP